jgi:hypothetical protein
MNRVVALGIVGWVAFAGLGGCQGPDPFDRNPGMTASGGHANGGGGHIVVGSGGSGAGGLRGSGGSGVGGSATGGRGAGGGAMGGRGMGGMGAGGMVMDGGVGTGGRGTGGSGVGGRIVDGGANCVTAIKNAGYSAAPAPPCSACMENGNSKATDCMMMIDCMTACFGMNNCELNCLHSVSGSGPLQGCVDALLMAGGCQ